MKPVPNPSQLEDFRCARATNLAFAVVNAQEPGTLTPATTVVLRHIEPTAPCACSCREVCGAPHGPESAA